MAVEANLGATVLRKDAGEGNSVLAEGGLILLAIDVAADLSFISAFGQDLGVFTDLSL